MLSVGTRAVVLITTDKLNLCVVSVCMWAIGKVIVGMTLMYLKWYDYLCS
jgi:hypothetical protein